MTPYAEVIGDPIAHSKSPLIHGFWLAKLGIDAEYRACHVRAERVEAYLASRRSDARWRGCNVTIPHKQKVAAHLDTLDDRARSVGAINTVYRDAHGTPAGTNTDVDGILEALPVTLMPPGSEVCILGTGGAARAALAACKLRDIGIVLLSARDMDTGWCLLEEFGFGGTVRPIDDSHNILTGEVIINATPLGMAGQAAMPPAILDHLAHPMPDAVVMDMVYSPPNTALLKAAARSGCVTVDGLTMLIGQAAAAFARFFGAPAPREHDAELRALLTA